jgi:hypothetical protein
MNKILLSLLSIILFTSQAWAGWKIIIHQNEDGQQDIITYYITKNTVKISTSNFDFIYAKADRQIIILNHKTKSYYQTSHIEYKTDLKYLYRVDYRSADAALPKSFILRFDDLLAQNIQTNEEENNQITPSLRVENANNDKNIANFETTEYDTYFNTSLIERIWLSQDVNVSNDMDIMEVLNFFRGHTKTQLKHSMSLDTQEYEQLLYRGFPMKIINYDNLGFEVYSYEVVLAQELEFIGTNMFSVPNSYQSRTLTDLILAKD